VDGHAEDALDHVRVVPSDVLAPDLGEGQYEERAAAVAGRRVGDGDRARREALPAGQGDLAAVEPGVDRHRLAEEAEGRAQRSGRGGRGGRGELVGAFAVEKDHVRQGPRVGVEQPVDDHPPVERALEPGEVVLGEPAGLDLRASHLGCAGGPEIDGAGARGPSEEELRQRGRDAAHLCGSGSHTASRSTAVAAKSQSESAPFAWKKAASSRERSFGRTIECCQATSAAQPAQPSQ